MKALLRSVEDRLERLGLKQSATRRLSDAEQYWAEAGTDRWRCDSHWRGASAFESDDDWFDYKLENDPRFLGRVERARQSLRSGRGIRLEDLAASCRNLES